MGETTSTAAPAAGAPRGPVVTQHANDPVVVGAGCARDEAARIADESLRAFIESMAAAGNRAGRHEIGMHHVHGWILEYDGTIGGSPIQAVIGVDGVIHVLREARRLLTHKWSASEWVLRPEASLDPVASATRFGHHLSRILAFEHVGVEARDEPPPWVLSQTAERICRSVLAAPGDRTMAG